MAAPPSHSVRRLPGDRLRAMYRGGHANATARRFVRAWNRLIRTGLLPRRWVVLEVAGRRTGRTIRYPMGLADVDGSSYLVAMLGECGWTRNARAAGGRVTLLRMRPNPTQLTEVPVADRPPILKRYLQVAPGGRPHIPVDRHEPVAAFEAVAADVPVFRIRLLDN